MDLFRILKTKIVPALRGMFGQDNVVFASDPAIPGVSGTVFLGNGIQRSFYIVEDEAGILLTCNCNNVTFADDKFHTDSPETMWDLMKAYISDHDGVGVVGRTWTKEEDLERRFGSLSGLNVDALTEGEVDEESTPEYQAALEPRLITA
jgi:hypothetical protein